MQLLPVLLNRGHDINRPAAGGKTAVSYAMDKLPRALTQSHLDHFLTAAGGNVDAADATTGRTLLMTAVDNCDIDLMRRLVLEFRADVNAADCFGATALHRACASGRRIGLVEQLLAFETIKINALDGEGQTPLHRAAIRGREAVVKLLIGKDTCDVNAADVLGNTALHHAVIEGHAGLVDLIVGLNTNPRPVSADKKRGGGGGGASGPGLAASASKRDKNAADGSLTRVVIDAENAAGLTPLECAVASAVAAAAAAKSRPDDDAAADANLAIVAKLLLGSASVRRIAATSKLSLLQLAVTARSLDLVAAFIGKQADVHHRCAADRTALHYAVELREMAIVAELIASGAQVDAQESVALRAPIHIACAHLDTEMVALLLANGASVNVVDNDFRTPLQLCCDRASSSSSSSPTLVPGALDRATTIGRALLAAGAQPVVRDRWKRTPLHYACAADAVELVRDLLCVPGGIPVGQTDATLATPLHTAAMHGAVRVVDLLCGLIETRHAAGNDQVRTSREIVCALEAALAAGKALVAAGASRAVKAGAENARPTDPLVAMRRAQLALDLEGAAATAARHILAAEDANSEAAQWRDGIRQRDGMGRTPTLIAAEAGCAQVAKRIAAALRVLAGKT